MNIIAIDVHITTLEFAVINKQGRHTKSQTIETSEKGMIEFIKTIPKQRKIYIEEGNLSSWIVETCSRFNETVVVTDPKINRWIGHDEEKYDKIDAIKLGRLAYGNYVKEIHHSVGERQRFREIILFYHDLVKSQTRIKNKIKSKFRQYAVNCTGTTVYKDECQNAWINKLPKHIVIRFMLQRLFKQLKQIENCIDQTVKLLKKYCNLYSEIKLFQELPGIGKIHSATISSLLTNPYRFSSKTKVWKYAGLGIVGKGSGGKQYSQNLTINYNRILKYTMKQAALSAIQSKPNYFSKKYKDLLMKNIHPNRALLTIARSMLVTMWAMWKKGEHFNPKIKNKIKI